MRHDDDKLMEGIEETMGRHRLLGEEVPADQTDDLKLNQILAKAAVQIRKTYNLDLKTAHHLHKAMMQAARAFMNLPSAAAGAALHRRMQRAMEDAEAQCDGESEPVEEAGDLGFSR